MRLLPIFLFTFLSATVFAQNTDPAFSSRQLHYLLKEKVRIRDIPAAIELFRQHPELMVQDAAATEISGVADRSAEILIHGDDKAESEVHAAINPTDTSNIIAAAILQDANSATSPLKVSVYYTKDFAQTWQSSNIVFSPNSSDGFVAGGGDPVLAFDKSGKAYISWLVLTVNLFGAQPVKLALYYSVSTNKGQTWTSPVVIDFGTITLDVLSGGNGTGSLVDKQWMATDRSGSIYEGNLYVSYTRFDIIDSSTVNSSILVKTKPKNNNNFGAAVKVHQGTYGTIQFSSIDVDDQGNVHVLFFAGNSDDDLALYYTGSSDGGATFQPEIKISDVHFPGVGESALNPIEGVAAGRLYPCPHIQAGKNPGTLFATWCSDGISQQETDGYDIWFSKSVDNGQNWQAPVRVNPGNDPQAEQYYPSLYVSDNGTISISYYDRTDDPGGTDTKYVVTHSFDGGQTFTPSVDASLVSSDFAEIGLLNDDFGIGEYTQVVCTDYYAIPIWSDGRTNDGNIDLYAAILPIGDAVSSSGEVGSVTDAFSVELPNPAKEKISLSVRLDKPSRIAIQVFDASGKLLYTEKMPGSQVAGTYRRDIPVTPGAYFCRVDTEYGFKVKKVVIQ